MTRAELERRAAELGIAPKTLRMRIYREGLRKRAKSTDEPPFETFGLKLAAETVGQLKELRSRLSSATARVGLARIEVERLLRSKLPAPVAQLQTLEELCLGLEQRIVEAMPRSLCPYCKGIDRVQVDCKPCGGAGLASLAQYEKAPRRFKDGPAIVLFEGRERPLSDFAAAPRYEPFNP